MAKYNCTGDKNNIGRCLFKLAENKRVSIGDIGGYNEKLRKLLEQSSTLVVVVVVVVVVVAVVVSSRSSSK